MVRYNKKQVVFAMRVGFATVVLLYVWVLKKKMKIFKICLHVKLQFESQKNCEITSKL